MYKFYSFYSRLIRYLLYALCCYFLLTCAAEQNADDPGQCVQKNECDGAKIAGYDMSVRFLDPFTSDVSLNCAALNSAKSPIPIRFLVEKPRTILPSEVAIKSSELGTTEASGTSSSETASLDRDPVSSISFQAFLLGGGGDSQNIQPILSDIIDESIYQTMTQGIVTPYHKWCTDSCGVGEILFFPNCAISESQVIFFGVKSGAVQKVIKFQLIAPTK